MISCELAKIWNPGGGGGGGGWLCNIPVNMSQYPRNGPELERCCQNWNNSSLVLSHHPTNSGLVLSHHIVGLTQDCGNSSALANELPHSFTKPSIYSIFIGIYQYQSNWYRYAVIQMYPVVPDRGTCWNNLGIPCCTCADHVYCTGRK